TRGVVPIRVPNLREDERVSVRVHIDPLGRIERLHSREEPGQRRLLPVRLRSDLRAVRGRPKLRLVTRDKLKLRRVPIEARLLNKLRNAHLALLRVPGAVRTRLRDGLPAHVRAVKVGGLRGGNERHAGTSLIHARVTHAHSNIKRPPRSGRAGTPRGSVSQLADG